MVIRVFFILCFIFPDRLFAENSKILIGLDTDMSAGSVRAGQAIQRGAEIAIAEINEKGGVLGKSMQLVVKDHRGNPLRGIDNIADFAANPDIVAILAGLHTPVAMQELEIIHAQKIPFLVPWAAGTPVIENGFSPNYAFRVSVRDEYAGGFLVARAAKRGYKNMALLLEHTGWGRSNEKAMTRALAAIGLKPSIVTWFNWGTIDMQAAIQDVIQNKPDVILMVANAPEGLAIVNAMAALSEADRLPIISHWGITGGNFYRQARDSLAKVDLSFLQTYSFLNPVFPKRAEPVIQRYVQTYADATSAREIFAPAGTAHAYDIVHLLARAIGVAGTTDRVAVRDALERLPKYQGLLRDYAPAFSPEKHDALDASDFNLSRFDKKGVIIPIGGDGA